MGAEAGTFVTPTVRLERPLGEGGMGSVWVAKHTTLHTRVVVKFIADAIATDADTVARFSREAAAAAAVRSPHVVQMHDHGVSPDGTPFIVMELLEGMDLAKHLEQRGPLPLGQVDVIVSHVCKALARAHEAGIVHRDIKPQNLFLCDLGDGEIFVKLLDFGVAKKGDALTTTRTGASVGTPFYMSPEQVLGEKAVGPRSDLWSLGVVAFEALTGERPFAGETVGALAIAICQGPLPVPSQVRPGLDRALDPWFAKACARDPAARFGSAREMADVLHLALARTEMGLAATIDSQRQLPRSLAPPPLAEGATTGAPVSGAGRPAGARSRTRVAGVASALLVTLAILFVLRGRASVTPAQTSLEAPVEPQAPAAARSASVPAPAPTPTASEAPPAAASATSSPSASATAGATASATASATGGADTKPPRTRPRTPVPPRTATSAATAPSASPPRNDLPPIE